jgi:hypothetical protein
MTHLERTNYFDLLSLGRLRLSPRARDEGIADQRRGLPSADADAV